MSKTTPTLATSSASTSITTRKNNIMSFKYLLAASILLRIVLLLYGEWQDANMTVKYTDIDYVVFTDAARFIVQGQSPYERATYRYTPLLAILLTPNILWFYSFGKCLFALADIGVGYIIHQILILRGMPSQRALWFDALWLLNPMVANISTRGNAESLLGIMVLGTLYFILTRKFYLSCFMFGLAVHFKIYPIIYAVTLLFLLDNDRYGDPIQSWPSIIYSYQQLRLSFLNFTIPHLATKLGITINSNTSSMNNNNSKDINKKNDWKYWFIEILQQTTLFFSPTRIMFGLCSGSVFFSLTWFMYQLYGHEFLHETYLYHVTRQDHRHNFSLWFYQMYLGLEHRWMGLLAFIPQLLLVTVTGIVFAKDIFFACFIQTFLFVTFNKVCTSQYFMWYICLFPLVLPSTDISFRWKGASLVLAWIISQALWLQSAYQLEFMGENTFISLWISSILFFISNCWIVVSFILNHQYERVYGKNGRIRSIYFIRP